MNEVMKILFNELSVIEIVSHCAIIATALAAFWVYFAKIKRDSELAISDIYFDILSINKKSLYLKDCFDDKNKMWANTSLLIETLSICTENKISKYKSIVTRKFNRNEMSALEMFYDSAINANYQQNNLKNIINEVNLASSKLYNEKRVLDCKELTLINDFAWNPAYVESMLKSIDNIELLYNTLPFEKMAKYGKINYTRKV